LIRWIQSKQWLSSVLVAATFFLLFGGIDFASTSAAALAVSACISLAIFSANRLGYLSSVFVALSAALTISLGLGLPYSVLGIALALYICAATARAPQRIILFYVSLAATLALVFAQAHISAAAADSALVLTQLALAAVALTLVYVVARLVITRVVHVGTSLDQKVATRESSKLALRLAEQEKRFQIAREITEVILQEVTAVLSQAEGGTYAAKVDPSAAARVLERVSHNARSAHQELRRLYDQLNRNLGIQAAPPGIDDLEEQIVLLRDYGYTAAIHHQGKRFEVTEGAGLAIYRLVFDALENVKDHVPVGASVSVDFTWVEEGMQILIKDNGIETANRAKNAVAEAVGQTTDTSYDMHDDLEALIQPIVGPSITAMRERAALYGGAVEVTKVPGVGFTVSAIFPQLRNLAGVSESN